MISIGPSLGDVLAVSGLAVYAILLFLEMAFRVRPGWRGTSVLAVIAILFPSFMLPAGAACFVASFIWSIVRCVNRRPDPSLARLPTLRD